MLKRYLYKFKELELREKILVLFVFSIPFERIPSLDVGGITLKLSLFLGTALIFINLKDIKLNSNKLLEKKLLILPALLLVYSLLSILWAQDSSAWLKANLNLGFVVAIFYSLSLSSKKNLQLILKTIFASSLVVIGFGFFQWFGDLVGLPADLTGIREQYDAIRLGLPRMHSVLLEPLYFSLFLLLPLGISLADRKNELFKNFYFRLGFISLIYLSILLSLARGAIVASAVMGLVAIFYNLSELKKLFNVDIITRLCAAALVIILVFIGAVSLLGKKGVDEDNNYSKGIGTITGHLKSIRPWGNEKDAKDENSLNSRDEARSEALSLIKRDLRTDLFGVGAGQYGANLELKQDSNATSNFVALDVWAQFGLVGLVILTFFGLSLVFGAKLNNPVSFGLVLYLVGFAIQSITFGQLAILHLWVGMAMLALVNRD
ncbi:MAG TPA: O-antigen ligase family protein [Candidatus Saccharimonadales bacterium]|nr:O-antigen ligase family protein [Candidatus Saccharimonadales bacterium]